MKKNMVPTFSEIHDYASFLRDTYPHLGFRYACLYDCNIHERVISIINKEPMFSHVLTPEGYPWKGDRLTAVGLGLIFAVLLTTGALTPEGIYISY